MTQLNELRELAQTIVYQARNNPPDCRLSYIEVQLSRDDIDLLASVLGEPVIDWHPEPCRHPDSKWAKDGKA